MADELTAQQHQTLETAAPSEVNRYRPSNGTEGHGFMAAWCDRCARCSTGYCPILGATFVFDVEDAEYPREWRIGDAGPECSAFIPHPDDIAVDQFAVAMKAKMAAARAKGRGGWETADPFDLARMLREHVDKGDPVDVANFAMMLQQKGSGIAPVEAPAPVAESEVRLLPPIIKEVLAWYASDPRKWIGFDRQSRAEEQEVQKSGHYFHTGDDERGHPEYAPNSVRAEEALAALVEWEEAALALPGAAAVPDGSASHG